MIRAVPEEAVIHMAGLVELFTTKRLCMDLRTCSISRQFWFTGSPCVVDAELGNVLTLKITSWPLGKFGSGFWIARVTQDHGILRLLLDGMSRRHLINKPRRQRMG